MDHVLWSCDRVAKSLVLAVKSEFSVGFLAIKLVKVADRVLSNVKFVHI